jgi:hypothetical protein
LSYFRIATKKFEIMVAPHFGNVKYFFIFVAPSCSMRRGFM